MSNKKQPISYKPKRRGKKGFSSTKNIVPTIVTIAAAGVICCFGYSIAKPILNNDNSVSVNGEISNDENSIVNGTTAPVGSTNVSKSTTDIVVLNGDKKTTTTVASTKTTSQTTDKEDKNPVVHSGEGIDGLGIPSSGDDYSTGGDNYSSGSDTGSGNSYSGGSNSGSGNSYSGGSSSGSGSNGNYNNNGDAPTPVSGVYKSVQCSVRLPESSVNDADSLRSMLKDVKSKYPNAGAVIIPMKLQGGELNYSSNAAGDAAYAVCKGSMTASEIAKIVREEGFYAYASCSLLEDHLYSSVYSNWNAGYRVEKNGVLTGDQWYDYFPDQGGQPWLDPNSDLTVAYLQNIIKELSSSGFSAVLCSDIKYPNFVQADEKYLNPDIYAKNPDALIKLANALN